MGIRCPQLLNWLLMRKGLLVIFLLTISGRLLAQTWETGVSAGGSGYMGDLNQQNPAKISGFNIGVFAQRNFNPYFALKLHASHAEIAGADSTSGTQQFRDRNLSFKTQLAELSLMAELNFMRFTPGADKDRFSPYVFFGLGAVKYNPQANYMGADYDLRPLMTEGVSYSNIAVVIPFGAGVKYNFSDKWNIMFSAGYRYALTDYLDDVSGKYLDKSKIKDPVLLALSDRSGEKTGIYTGSPRTQRGDYRSHDTYLFLGFTLSFTFVTANCYY